MTNAAFHFVAEGYDTRGQGLIKGRRAAGEGFLKGYARHSGEDFFYCFAASQRQARHFSRLVADGRAGRKAQIGYIPFAVPEKLAEPGMLFHPGPDLGHQAWARRLGAASAYGLCGVTHTICSKGAIDAIGDLLTLPVHPWDAVICTSEAVRRTVQGVLDARADYLHERLGVRPSCPIELPVIPLGVDSDILAPSAQNRRLGIQIRTRLGIADAAVAVLFFGRLSYHAKANPLPLFLAAAEAARAARTRLHLIFAGEFANDTIARDFRAAGQALCPEVPVSFLDGRNPTVRRGAWHAADIFASPSDNIQETFGLAPVEAMAAGLPSVVSDWDGYRDTVRDGIDGYLIPTVTAGPGAGAALARRYHLGLDDYDHYIGYASQATAVDVPAFTAALTRLVADKALRTRMGAAARQRAVSQFDWQVVVGAYRALWDALDARRRAADPPPAGAGHPLRRDPFTTFHAYPSAVFDIETDYRSRGESADFERLVALALMRFAGRTLLAPEALKALWRDPNTGDRDDPAVRRSLVWLLKADLIRPVG